MKTVNIVSVYGYPSGEVVDFNSDKLLTKLQKDTKLNRLFHRHYNAIDGEVVWRFLDKDVNKVKSLLTK